MPIFPQTAITLISYGANTTKGLSPGVTLHDLLFLNPSAEWTGSMSDYKSFLEQWWNADAEFCSRDKSDDNLPAFDTRWAGSFNKVVKTHSRRLLEHREDYDPRSRLLLVAAFDFLVSKRIDVGNKDLGA